MSFAIRRLSQDHLGFILMSGEKAEGDCIFRSLPRNSKDFQSPDSLLLFELQERGEFSWLQKSGKITIRDDHDSVVARIENNKLYIGNYVFEVISLQSS
jgi:hypothetical protein